MENLPDSLYENYNQVFYSASSSSTSPPPDIRTFCMWINDLRILPVGIDFQFRARSDSALQNLADNRNSCEVLPLLLWNSKCTIGRLLEDVVTVYPLMSSPAFSQMMPTRLLNIFLLFQCITRNPYTRSLFLKAKMQHYIYPFMDIDYTDQPLEFIRVGALRVITNMLKPLDEDVVRSLTESGVISHCTKPIEFGSTVAKTLAAYILYKIMSTREGLNYCCILGDRFVAINSLLQHLLVHLSSMDNPSSVLFTIVVASYAMLSKKPRARDGLRQYKPTMLFDETFASLFAMNEFANDHRKQLIQNLEN